MAKTQATSTFVMHGARAAMEGGMLHIETQVESLESAVGNNTGLAFDLAKTLVESACKTILTERSIVYSVNDDLPKLFKIASQQLPFLPTSASSEANARKSLAQTLSGLSTALQGIAELRNAYGFASHGADGPRPVMEGAQALLAAQAADAIVGFLHRVHRQEQTVTSDVRLEYADNAEFNEYVDEAHETVFIFDLDYRPSDVLFNVDREVYRSALKEYEAELEAEPDEDNDPSGEGTTP